MCIVNQYAYLSLNQTLHDIVLHVATSITYMYMYTRILSWCKGMATRNIIVLFLIILFCFSHLS